MRLSGEPEAIFVVGGGGVGGVGGVDMTSAVEAKIGVSLLAQDISNNPISLPVIEY